MHSAEQIAEYILDESEKVGKPINNLRLQKDLYFVQAEFLVNTDHPCFAEDIVAWNFGPVVPNVYRKYEKYGNSAILYIENKEAKEMRKKDKKRIDSIMDKCKN